jgi:hypothetical protein
MSDVDNNYTDDNDNSTDVYDDDRDDNIMYVFN